MEHNKKRNRLETQTGLFLPTFLLLLLISGCGGVVPPPPKKAGTAPQDKPLVESTIPSDLEVGVILNKSVSVAFSKEMSSETLTPTNFFLNDVTIPTVPVPVPGTVTLTGTTAVFKPTVTLKGSTPFKVTVTKGVQDTFGNFLAEERMWTFTTAAITDPGSTDTDPPRVLSTNPINGATNVSTNTTISVTFNEAIDPATVIALANDATDTFKVSKSTKATKIIISADNKTFTFVPEGKLKDAQQKETRLDVTITTGVKDLAGNPLSADFIWFFTTRPEPTGGEK